MIEIRKAKRSDLEFMQSAFNALNKLHHDAAPEEFKPPEEIESSKNLARYVTEEPCLAFVAVISDCPVGFIAGHVRELVSPITRKVFMGSVDELFVSADNRSCGIGSMLLEKFAQACKNRGASDLFVEIWEFNERARAFYEAHGLSTRVRWAGKKL